MIKIVITLLVVVVLTTSSYGQRMPSVGEVIKGSPEYRSLVDGCSLGFDKRNGEIFCVGFDSVAISFRASDLNTATANPPSVLCGEPCYAQFLKAPGAPQKISADWVMPSTQIKPKTVLLSWAAVSDGVVAWALYMCSYNVNQPACLPAFVSTTIGTGTAGNRADDFINIGSLSFPASSHVIMEVSRAYSDTQDTLINTANLEAIRVEFDRKYP